jgi:hypothetical protein
VPQRLAGRGFQLAPRGGLVDVVHPAEGRRPARRRHPRMTKVRTFQYLAPLKSLRSVARLAAEVERHDYVSGNVTTGSLRRHQMSVAPRGSAWPNCQLQLQRQRRRDHPLSPPGWHHRRWCHAVEAATGPAAGPWQSSRFPACCNSPGRGPRSWWPLAVRAGRPW